jgi:hypothetical protein
VLLSTGCEQAAGLQLDGVPVTVDNTWLPGVNNTYIGKGFVVSPGPHYIRHVNNAPFGLYVYGISTDDCSYSYAGGQCLNILPPVRLLGNIRETLACPSSSDTNENYVIISVFFYSFITFLLLQRQFVYTTQAPTTAATTTQAPTTVAATTAAPTAAPTVAATTAAPTTVVPTAPATTAAPVTVPVTTPAPAQGNFLLSHTIMLQLCFILCNKC